MIGNYPIFLHVDKVMTHYKIQFHLIFRYLKYIFFYFNTSIVFFVRASHRIRWYTRCVFFELTARFRSTFGQVNSSRRTLFWFAAETGPCSARVVFFYPFYCNKGGFIWCFARQKCYKRWGNYSFWVPALGEWRFLLTSSFKWRLLWSLQLSEPERKFNIYYSLLQ